MHQERGLCHVARKDAPQAIDALLRAVNINPALAHELAHAGGRLSPDAATRQMRRPPPPMSRRCSNLPPEVVTATSLFSDGELAPAEQIIRAFLLRHGNHPEAMRLLAKIGMARDVLDDAELLAGGGPDPGARITGRRATTMPRPWCSGTNMQKRASRPTAAGARARQPGLPLAGRHHRRRPGRA